MNTSMNALREHLSETSLLESTIAALEWDEHTGMPSQAAEFRAQQLSFLTGLVHQRRTDPRIEEWLDQIVNGTKSAITQTYEVSNLESSQVQALVRTLRKDFQRNRKLPQTLVEEIASATSMGQQTWVQAKQEGRYELFLPYLKKILQLRLEEAKCLVEDGQSLYDALLDPYEEGMRTDRLQPIFAKLLEALVPLVQRASEASKRLGPAKLIGPFPIDAQRSFSKWVAEQIGFDFERGRLDETVHPFCTTLGPHDHRILTRYSENSFSSGLYGVLHEAGHGMYEQGLDVQWYGTPLGAAASLGIHESQSRLWENFIGLSDSFWQWAYPHAAKHFPMLQQITKQDLTKELRKVEPSLIRIEADEVTYNLHILLRFELELALINQDLSVDDLPEAWNEKMQKYLGQTPPDDRFGVLQDVHWSAGLIGYFPTYTLGNIYAAQLMHAADRDLGGVDQSVARGEFNPLLKWLRERIHRFGRSLQPNELIESATQEPVKSDYLIEHLRTRCESLE